MSTRPNWSRFVVSVFAFVLITISAVGLSVYPQALVLPANAAPTEAGAVGEKPIEEEFFPYASGAPIFGFGSDGLITGTSYPFSVQAGVALENMSSGTTELVGPGVDDNASAVTNIGFDFWFDGVRHSQFSVNANGLARLGSVVIGTTFNNSTSGLGTTTNAPKIAPYFEDLCVGTNGKVHYKVVGSAPNRKLIVEWSGMQIPRNTACLAAPATGVFQLWLFESAGATNPGRIQFVYGDGVAASDADDLGASIGLQSGVATNFASVTVTDDTVSYTVANNTNLPGVAAGKSYLFTPNVPVAPTGLSFGTSTGTTNTLNWTDNATNEVGYAIYRSTDGMNYSFVAQTAADAVTFTDTNLTPSTTYFYNVYAATEGVLSSPALNGSKATTAGGSDTCAGAGGDYSNPATWADGTVPTADDNVTIQMGCTVTVDTAGALALSLTVATGGTIQSPLAGAVTTNNLTVGGSVVNNGTLDFSTNADTSGAILTFGAGGFDVSLTGSGATTDIRAITIAKGSIATTVELAPTNFTVQGVNTDVAGFLTLTSGTFKISGTFTITNRVFTTAAYTIPAAGGLWLNNPNFTVAGQNGSPTATGVLRLTSGTYNVGTSSGNSLGGGAGGQFIIEGGVLNTAGRLQTTSAVSYTQSGGTVNVCTVGNTATTACFGLTSAANVFNLTGGTIVLVLPNTNAAPLDWSVSSTSTFVANPAGTTLQVGGGATPPASTFRVLGNTPNILISSGQNMAVGSGTAGGAIFFRGSTVTNNGAIVIQGTGASSRFDWAAAGPMTYAGTGTFGTAGTPFAGVGMSANGANTTVNSPIFVNRINLFTGGFVNSNQITLGNGGTSTTVIQVGNSTTPTAAGTFDVSPVYNTGSGGHTVLSLRTTTLNRSTGFEINPTRTLGAWTIDDNAAGGTLNVVGGDITVAGNLTLTNGVLVTGASTITHGGTAARTNGFVKGNLSRNFAAPGTYTYHLGDGAYSPVAANVTAGTGSLTASAVATAQPNIPTPAKALSRHWKLAGTGVTSDLTFTYVDPADIPVTANEAAFVIQKYDGTFTQPGGTVDTTANTASITGVTSFSDWTLAEPGALVAPGALQLSSSTYSANENAGNIAVTVNRVNGSDGAVTVDYSLGGGTATGGAACGAGIDYVNTGGTVMFANGETTKMFNVALCGDTDVEPDETFDVTLSNPTGGATLGSPTVATATILNDDTAGDPVSVTASAGTPTGGYATLTAAIAAVNNGTHQGNIVINVNASTTEPGSVILNSSGAGAASYTSILIRPTADGLTVSGASVQGRGLIELNGADNVTIDGDNPNSGGTNRNLTVQNTATNTTTFTSVIRIAMNTTTVNSADNNIFRNLNIVGSATGRNIDTATTTTGSENTTFGIFSGPNASGPETAPNAITSVLTGVATGATAANLMVGNNSVATAARAISINGSATGVHTGLQVTGNSIGNAVAGEADQVTAIGITVNGATTPLIANNTVYVEGHVASSAAGHGINVGVNSTNTTGATIEKNKVNRVKNNNTTTWSAMGINIAGIAASGHTVRNNFISGVINNQIAGTGGFGTTFGSYGIRIASGTLHKVYHNSVHLYGAMPGVTNTNLTAAFLVVGTGQTGMDVRNNIFSNQISGGNPTGTRNVAVFLPSGATSAMNLTWNNNAYYVGADALNRLAQVGTTFGTGEYQAGDFDPTQTTPATNFRAYTSTLSAAGTNDNASFAITGAPPFVSNTDLHIPAGTGTRLESGGAAVGVTEDIDLEMRNATTPDIGADEFAGNPAPANDIGAVGFVVPANGSTIPTGGLTPQARFTNAGTATQTNVTVRFRIFNSSMMEIYNQTAVIPSIGPLQNIVVSFPMTTISTPGMYTMQAAAELVGDQNTGNDIINGAFNTVVPITGTVNVGTGETFTSLTNPGGLFEALNLAGLGGNLTVNITSDLTGETGVVVLNQLAESAPGGYTVTFKPSGAARTISGTPAVNVALITLHGADRIVFDGSLSGGTDRSLTITNNQTGTTTVFWIRSASAANGASNNTIKNCIINGAATTTAQTTAGILGGSGVTLGGPAEAPNNNNTITNNWIYRVQNSLYNQGNVGLDQNWTVTNNEFGSSVEADKNKFRGMLMGNANNFVISGNFVHGVSSFATTTAAMSGIQLAFVPTNGSVHSNRISDIRNTSATGTGAFGMQLSAAAGTLNNVIANNFISDVQAAGSATVASNGHGITINAAAPTGAYKIYHNSINMNTNQASGTTAAVNLTSAVVAAGAIDLRNNILANTQTAGATRRAVHSAAAATVFGTINYNNYFSTGSVGFIGGVDRPTLADWQTGTSQDVNSKAVDPLFVSPTDLHIQAGSPMINMGVAGTGVTTDIDGQTRDGMPDIGADEIVAGGMPGVLQFSAPTYTVGEAGPTATITVTRTGGSDGTVTVDYATVAGGTATGGASCTAGIDYVTTNGTLTFVGGDTSETFNVTICQDAADEPDETVNLALTNPTGGATIGAQNTAVLTITDDDGPPTAFSVAISDARVFEGDAGTANLVFNVTLTSNAPPLANGGTIASVQYATANGTATAGSDYTATMGTINFPTTGTQMVTVQVSGDTAKESNEFLFVNLSNPSLNTMITDGQGAGIIVDEDRPYVADFDRDRKADFSVFRPSSNDWYILRSSDAQMTIGSAGPSGETPVPGDYDGDGKTDIAVFQGSAANWFILRSSDSTTSVTQWGVAADKPVQGDYDKDGKADLAIYRPSTGTWWVLRSSNGSSFAVPFGLSADRPVQGDYDGDAQTDFAVYRDGTWYIFRSSDSNVQIGNWGLASDKPVSGDFDGDGRHDLAIYRSGTWWILNSLSGSFTAQPYGLSTDIPAPADFDGDGSTDRVVFRPSSGDWYVLPSLVPNSTGVHWGTNGDVPIPSAYIPQ